MKQRKLTGTATRASLIASFAAEPAPPKPDAEAPEGDAEEVEESGPDLQADTEVLNAINAAIAAQEKDPDSESVIDKKVLALLQQAKAAQAEDIAETAETPAEEPAEEPVAAAAVEPVAEEEAEPEEANKPPAVEAGENLGPAFSGVLVIEGQPTGDGREIAPDALTWRDPPLPLMLLATETHDPEGFDMNDPAVMAGRIDTLTREPGETGTQLVKFTGNFLATEEGMHAAELTEQMGRMGISADIAVQDREITITEADEYGFPIDGTETLTEGTVMGGTACPFPAFEGCYIVLGDGTDMPEAKAIPQAAEMPEVPDTPPAVVANGGQLLHLMTYEECTACDEGIEVIVASGAGPIRPPKAWFEDPGFTDGDGRLMEILSSNGRSEGKKACPITVTADGQVYGHIAPWGVCHVGKPGCVTAPPSAVGYAHFKRGQHILTAEGEKVGVGAITADAAHAPMQMSALAAMGHYDNTAYTVADVNAGDDEFGIWVAGAIRPDATEEQIRTLTAASLSGDWREIGRQLELVAALCVPVPGFPMAVIAHGHQEALVAYGAKVMDHLKPPVEGDDGLLRLAAPALKRLVRSDARERVAALTS